MVALAGIVGSFIASVIAWLARKFVIAKILLGVQAVIQGIVIVFIVSFFGAMVYLVNYVYELFYSFASTWDNYNPSNAQVFFALLDASGVGPAFVTVVNMYLIVLFLLLAKFLWLVFINVVQKLYGFARDDIDLLAQ